MIFPATDLNLTRAKAVASGVAVSASNLKHGICLIVLRVVPSIGSFRSRKIRTFRYSGLPVSKLMSKVGTRAQLVRLGRLIGILLFRLPIRYCVGVD